MFKEIMINAGEEETRVAVLEDRILVEMYIERSLNQRLVGNIFRGRVENVLPGMQAAFVDIGLERNAFLYVEDALPSRSSDGYHHSGLATNISDILKRGQDIIVQIVKEPIGTKGPRVTTQITLPGRYVVLMPTMDYIGISRRIDSDRERERLKELAARFKPEGMGLIVRTVAEGVEEEDFTQDVQLLTRLWRKIIHRGSQGPVPNLIHRDLELIQRILRDVFTEDVDRLTVDSRYEYEKIMEVLDISAPRLKYKVFLKKAIISFGITVSSKSWKRHLNVKFGLSVAGIWSLIRPKP